MKYIWLSAHLFYSGNLDLILTQLVEPFIEQHRHLLSKGSPWFFIRYWEGGSHIRLRLHCTEGLLIQKHLTQAAQNFFQLYPAERQLSTLSNQPLLPDNSVQFIDYVPEIQRYGNEKSIIWAEEYFTVCSSVVLNWLKENKVKPASRIIQAIKHHLILIFAAPFSLMQGQEMCRQFIDDWLKPLCVPSHDLSSEKALWLQQFNRSLSPQRDQLIGATRQFTIDVKQKNLPPALQLYYSNCHRILSCYENAGFTYINMSSIIQSFFHMTHNRLGIANREEAYVMYCTMECLNGIQ